MREAMGCPLLTQGRKTACLVRVAAISVGIAVTGLAAAVLAPGSRAAQGSAEQAAPVAGGVATIAINRNVVKAMERRGVTVSATRPGKMRRNSVRLPLAKGSFRVDTNNPVPLEPLAIEGISGQTSLRGGLKFVSRSRGRVRQVRISNLRVDLDRRRVTARVGRRNVKLFAVNMAWATPTGVRVDRPRLLSAPLRLAPAAARTINRSLGRNLLKRNSGFGQLSLSPVLAM